MPPAQYVHKPHMAVIEKRLSWEELHEMCRGPGNVLACSFMERRKHICLIVLPKNSNLTIEKLRQHEQAHCNGWPSNHPGGHMEIVG